MLDRTRLAKVLALTTSTNDAEALAAIRKANDIISGEKMQWSEVLAVDATSLISITIARQAGTPATAPVDGDDSDWKPPHLSERTIIEPMFNAIYSQPRTGSEDFWRWLDDVHEQWRSKQRLSPGQYTALRRCYNRTRKRA